MIAYKHAGPAPTIVTAAVDRISIIHAPAEWCSLHLSGFVSYVGSSSMEVSLEARRVGAGGAPAPGAAGLLLTCAFTMVARDPARKTAMRINPLAVATPAERAIFARGEARKRAKIARAQRGLATRPPDEEESALVHRMWRAQEAYADPQHALAKPDDTAYMAGTRMMNTMIMQPQFRNRHSFMIFGGYLMRQTMELAFCCAAAFAHQRPTFVSLDPSTFEAPVPVGSILYLDATVAYTEGTARGGSIVQVRVESRVQDVEHGKMVATGVFNYSFHVSNVVKVMRACPAPGGSRARLTRRSRDVLGVYQLYRCETARKGCGGAGGGDRGAGGGVMGRGSCSTLIIDIHRLHGDNASEPHGRRLSRVRSACYVIGGCDCWRAASSDITRSMLSKRRGYIGDGLILQSGGPTAALLGVEVGEW